MVYRSTTIIVVVFHVLSATSKHNPITFSPSSRYDLLRGETPSWVSPGCHKVGHTRQINIPECVEFKITTNACRGYCESYTIPSSEETLSMNPQQVITSIAQCCTISETEDVKVDVLCVDGVRELTFKSAKACQCYVCMND